MAAQCLGIPSKEQEYEVAGGNEFDWEKSPTGSNTSSVWSQASTSAQSKGKIRSTQRNKTHYESTYTSTMNSRCTVDIQKVVKQIKKARERSIAEKRMQKSSDISQVQDKFLSESVESFQSSQRKRLISYGSEIEVSSMGTTLMSDIKCPTVLIKIPDGQLLKSSVYYVLLEPKLGKFKGEIAALLFSDVLSADNDNTQSAELLPLVVRIKRTRTETVSLKPMLLYNCYRDMFKEGSKFNLNVLKFGRQYVPVGSQLLKKLIIKDIEMMPEETVKLLRPLEILKDNILCQTVKSSAHIKPIEEAKKLSELVPELRLRGVKARGGSRDFARWFETVPPNVLVDVDFKCDRGILRKDHFRTADMLDRYLGLPRIV